LLAAALAACAGGGSTTPAPIGQPPGVGSNGGPTNAPATPTPVPTATPTPAPSVPPAPAADPALHVPSGFLVSKIAQVGAARQLAALPNGDLIVGTGGTTVAIVPNAESPGAAGTPSTFATINEAPTQGVAYGGGYVFIASQFGVYRIPYSTGAQSGTPQKIASLRPGGNVGHVSSSVTVSGSALYVSVGSSCNSCVETDPTRATIQRMGLDGSGMTAQARRWRNAIGITTDPTTGTVWAGGAGQDYLLQGHPYEYVDAVSTRAAPADYGWPDCEENRVAYTQGANCSNVVVPPIVVPAYSTIIGVAVYPASQTGAYVFPAAWRGGLFVSMHGSWHAQNGVAIAPPHVAFVPLSGNAPARAVNWNDPTTQWNDFFTGFQNASGARIGRSTGVAVGSQGSLFVADDDSGSIYRIRPSALATSSKVRP
jgi:glucose/arabinose dehydrogenase